MWFVLLIGIMIWLNFEEWKLLRCCLKIVLNILIVILLGKFNMYELVLFKSVW